MSNQNEHDRLDLLADTDPLQLRDEAFALLARAEKAEAELEALHAGEDPTPCDEAVWPTPSQWIHKWNRLTAEQRLEMADRVVRNASDAQQCVLSGHRQAEAERNKAYRERAHLVAHLASLYPAVITRQPDEPDWPIIYITTPAGQMSWHISQPDVELFAHVPQVDPGDERAAWDGHTTDEKYRRLTSLIPPFRVIPNRGDMILTAVIGDADEGVFELVHQALDRTGIDRFSLQLQTVEQYEAGEKPALPAALLPRQSREASPE